MAWPAAIGAVGSFALNKFGDKGEAPSTGGTSDSSFSNQSDVTQAGYAPALEEVNRTLLPKITQFSDLDTTGIFTGSRLGDLNAQETIGQDQLLNAGAQFDARGDQAYQGLQGFLNNDASSVQNQLQRSNLGNRITQQFTQGIQPGIEDLGTASGQFGGNQQNIALGAASQGLANAIGQSELGMLNADRDRQLKAIGMAPGLAQMGLVQGGLTNAVGQQRTLRAQLGLEDEIQDSEGERNAGLRAIQELSGVLNPTVNFGGTASETRSGEEHSVTTGTGTPGRGSDLQALASGGLLAQGIYNDYQDRNGVLVNTAAPITTGQPDYVAP
jgi:hypothetical protein